MRYDFKDPHDTMLAVASRLGFERQGGVLIGQVREIAIRARFERPVIGDGESGLEISASGSALPLRVTLTSLTHEGAIAPRTIGDPSFDACFRIGGDAAETYACLAAPLRSELLSLAVGTAQLSLIDRRLIYREPEFRARDGAMLEHAVRAVMRIARALAAADELDSLETLRNTTTQDPHPGVRHGALRALLETAPESPPAKDAIERALAGEDPRARIIAAPHASARGIEALLEMVRDPNMESLRSDVLRTLERVKDPHVPLEAIAIDLLSAGEAEARIAAAEVLGRIGTLTAVQPLLDVASALLTSRELEQAALRSARAIQERAGGEPGRLSLNALDERGMLSNPESDPGGELSVHKS